MRIDQKDKDEVIIRLDRKEVDLLELVLERASFIDTPPGRQEDILRFADELLKGLPKMRS